MLKGAGIGSIIKLTLAVMIASLFISMATIGSLGEALFNTFDEIGESTDLTVEVDDVETLSDLTMFVTLRSVNEGCDKVEEQIEEDGFPGLEGTRLTDEPECFGTEEENLATDNLPTTYGDDQNQMPGIFSRERYEMTDHVRINSSRDQHWIEDRDNIMWATDDSRTEYQDFLEDISGDELEEDDDNIFVRGIKFTKGIFDDIGEWTRRNVPFATKFPHIDPPSTEVAGTTVFFNDGSTELRDRSNVAHLEDRDDAIDDIEDLDLVIQFCEGDKGYIQGSRGQIDSDTGVTSEDIVYPTIVVEEAEQEECGQVLGFSSYRGPQSGTQIHYKGTEAQFRNDYGAPDVFKINRDHNAFDSFNLHDESDSNKCPIVHQDKDLLGASGVDSWIDGLLDDFEEFAKSSIRSAVGGTYGGDVAEELVDLAFGYLDDARDYANSRIISAIGTATPDRATMEEYSTGTVIDPIEEGIDLDSETKHRQVGIGENLFSYTISVGCCDWVPYSDGVTFSHTLRWPRNSYYTEVPVTENYEDYVEGNSNLALLDDRGIAPEATKQLRPKTMNLGYNRLYGEVRCDRTGSEAQWHICTEQFDGDVIGGYECVSEEVGEGGEWVEVN